MDVIRHDDPFVQGGDGKMGRDLPPADRGRAAGGVQNHAPVDHRPEERPPIRDAQRDKADPAPGVIVPAHPDRPPVMDPRVVPGAPGTCTLDTRSVMRDSWGSRLQVGMIGSNEARARLAGNGKQRLVYGAIFGRKEGKAGLRTGNLVAAASSWRKIGRRKQRPDGGVGGFCLQKPRRVYRHFAAARPLASPAGSWITSARLMVKKLSASA